jgi:endonuclease YncB( thermonuclease family)
VVTTAVVRYVVDGDTLRLRNGAYVRLVQIDAPEDTSVQECFGAAATRALRRLLPPGTVIRLVTDPRLDRVDRYGRLLRYVLRAHDGLNANVALVRAGDAAPYFYDGDRGRHWRLLRDLALRARGARRGLWGACGRVAVDFYRGVDTGPPR